MVSVSKNCLVRTQRRSKELKLCKCEDACENKLGIDLAIVQGDGGIKIISASVVSNQGEVKFNANQK